MQILRHPARARSFAVTEEVQDEFAERLQPAKDRAA